MIQVIISDDIQQLASGLKKKKKKEVLNNVNNVAYLLSKPAGVPVDSPWAKCHAALGDGPPDHPFVVGSERLCAKRQEESGSCNPTKMRKRKRAQHLEADASCTCGFSKYGDVVRISSKWTDVPVHPSKGCLLVPKPIVSWKSYVSLNPNQSHWFIYNWLLSS